MIIFHRYTLTNCMISMTREQTNKFKVYYRNGNLELIRLGRISYCNMKEKENNESNEIFRV